MTRKISVVFALAASLALAHGLPAIAKESKASDKPAASGTDEKTNKVRLAHIIIKGSLPESPGKMSLFGDLGIDLRKTIHRLDKAAEDDSVAGVVLEIETSMGRGKLNELRQAIRRVRAAGKKVYAQLESATGPQYQLAAACDEIIMPEAGMVMIPGIRAEVGFYKNMLGKLGIEADFIHVGEAKGAAEPYTRESLSEPVRKNLTEMIDDLYDQMLTTLASDRQLQADDVKKAVNQGLLTARQAKEAGLIDRVAYPDEFHELKEQYKADELAYVMNYAKKKVDTDFSGPMGMMKLFQAMMGGTQKARDKGPAVAIVYAVGPIMSGKSQSDPFGGSVMGSTTIVKALDKAAEDDSVKAIVMRVDSPGGSALASDLIWHATQRIEKPILVSMGDVAGSGGYYIAMGADRILAEPGTITGSIGVVSGKFDMGGLYDKIGLSTEIISRGDNSGIFSSLSKFSDSEREVLESMMHEIYDIFTTKAANGRSMDLEELKKLAGGKVYTGRVAKRLGLIDEVGTLQDAVSQAKTMGGIGADDDFRIKVYPEPGNPFEVLFGAEMDEQREARIAIPAAAVLVPEVKSALRHAWHMKQISGEPGALWMPYLIEIQ